MIKSLNICILVIQFLFIPSIIFAEANIKHPNVSGQFYPQDKTALSNQIDEFFRNVKDERLKDFKDKDIFAVISPHAGYIYSGQVAAHSFKVIKEKSFDSVIVLGFSHSYVFKGASVYKEGVFRTPLGDIEVDKYLVEKLISSNSSLVNFIPQAFEGEHSLEVQLPFLQKSLGNLKIVPIILGQLDYTDCVALARLLVEITKGKKVLVVTSTDLSHYHQYLKAVEMDSKAISYMKNLDALGLWQSNLKQETELCGIIPVLILLNYARELGLKAELLNYANSGDVTGDKTRVVGYGSVVFFKEKLEGKILNYFEGRSEESEESMFTPLHPEGYASQSGDEYHKGLEPIGESQPLKGVTGFSLEQKKKLLYIARQTITEYVTFGRQSKFNETDAALNLKRGAFVTLHKHGELRGCIGTFTSNEPLYQVISNMAIESATKDPRFSKVTKEELDKIKIEISVLTEPQLINDWKNIRLGIDGVIVRRGFASGVFLPQVATETKWDLETFLSQLCAHKAGLPSDCYKDPKTQIYTFQAIIFSEDDYSEEKK